MPLNLNDQSDIIKKSYQYVQNLLQQELPADLFYHDLSHTERVVNATDQLAALANLDNESKETLALAAIFHDVGFVKEYEDHERISCHMAEEYLKKINVSVDKIQKVKELIMSTADISTSNGVLEEILHDADLCHLGKKKFFRPVDQKGKNFSRSPNLSNIGSDNN